MIDLKPCNMADINLKKNNPALCSTCQLLDWCSYHRRKACHGQLWLLFEPNAVENFYPLWNMRKRINLESCSCSFTLPDSLPSLVKKKVYSWWTLFYKPSNHWIHCTEHTSTPICPYYLQETWIHVRHAACLLIMRQSLHTHWNISNTKSRLLESYMGLLLNFNGNISYVL